MWTSRLPASQCAQHFRLKRAWKTVVSATDWVHHLFCEVEEEQKYFSSDYNNHYANGDVKRTRRTCEQKWVHDFSELMLKGAVGLPWYLHLRISICKNPPQTELMPRGREKKLPRNIEQQGCRRVDIQEKYSFKFHSSVLWQSCASSCVHLSTRAIQSEDTMKSAPERRYFEAITRSYFHSNDDNESEGGWKWVEFIDELHFATCRHAHLRV